MSELKQISPLLDNLMTGDSFSEHHGVRCYPAMREETDEKYIVKVISLPSSATKLDALLLTGACPDAASAMRYFGELSDGILEEVNILKQLSDLEGFLAYTSYQQEFSEEEKRYDVYLLSPYRRTLTRQFTSAPLTHLGAINLGLDLCAALTVARRAGYLYVDLKPNNVCITPEGEYKIGDIGFIRMDSLKYASLPDRYRSEYTAPEISDASCALNDTLDVYALGLILYQAYNSGMLPDMTDPQLSAPAYADYEMSEIILKALAKNPEDRWQTPIAFGQALVSYMQRNGANDAPIVPPAPTPEDLPEKEIEEDAAAPEELSASDSSAEEIAGEEAAAEEDTQDSDETADPEDDEFENLSFLDDVYADASDLSEEELSYEQFDEDVSEILEQADDLAAHEVPQPVIPPEPIEVPVPEPIQPDKPGEEAQESSDAEETSSEEDAQEKAPKKKSHWLRNSVIVLAILALLSCGAFLFLRYYLLPIDGIRLEGDEDRLTVYVSSQIDDSLLLVICSDPHGNHLTAPVKNGAAVFENLIPDTAYSVKVLVSGLHKLTGDVSTAYSTPVQTSILQFSGVTGATPGSIILGFNIDGPDSDQWTITYFAEDGDVRSVTFPSHMITLDGFTVGKEYTFRLEPEDDLYISGQQEIKVTASDLVYAENLAVSSLEDGFLTAIWNSPEGVEIESWTVRCYSESGYSKTLVVDACTVTFNEIDESDSYTVEVIAAGMSVGQRIFVSTDSTVLSNIQASEKNNALTLSWDSSKPVPGNGWVLRYSVDGHLIPTPIYCSENAAIIRPLVPGSEYRITIEGAGSENVVGTPFLYKTADAKTFTCSYGGYNVSASDMIFKMCITPQYSNWNRYSLSDSDYTTSFHPGQNASFLVQLTVSYGTSYDEMAVVFVIRDTEGTPVSISTIRDSWTNLWYRNYCELDVPAIPQDAGEYTIDVFFDGALAHSGTFTVGA